MALSNYQRVKRWRGKNKAKVAAQATRRRHRHREQLLAQQKRWRDANVERLRPVEAAKQRNYRATKPELQRERTRRFKARQEAKLVASAGRPRPLKCELCGESARTVFDHCHASGKFRGWLCDRCNRTLGQVKDDVALLQKMIRYILNGGADVEAHLESA